MIVTSFYCDLEDNYYFRNNAKKIKEFCDSNNIENYIVERKYGDDWISNVKAKPTFLKEVIDKFDKPILWLDADSQITNNLDINNGGDWGVCFRDNGTPHDFIHYISNNEKTKKFIDKWIQVISNINCGSHAAFIEIYEELDIFTIPDNIVKIGLSDTKKKKEYFNG